MIMYLCVHAYICMHVFLQADMHESTCNYVWMDGYRQKSMKVCMCVHIHTYRILFLAACLLIIQYISDHRYERTNMAAK